MSFGEGAFGEGGFGKGTTDNPLNLHIKPGSQGPLAQTLEWDKQTGVAGFRLFKNGAPISSTWQADKTTWRVSYNVGDTFEVRPIAYKPGSKITV